MVTFKNPCSEVILDEIGSYWTKWSGSWSFNLSPPFTEQDWLESFRNGSFFHDAHPLKARMSSEDARLRQNAMLMEVNEKQAVKIAVQRQEIQMAKSELETALKGVVAVADENEQLKDRLLELEAKVLPEKGSW